MNMPTVIGIPTITWICPQCKAVNTLNLPLTDARQTCPTCKLKIRLEPRDEN